MRNLHYPAVLYLSLLYWLALMLAPEQAHAQLFRRAAPARPVYVKVCWHGRAYYLQQQQQSAPPVIINNPPPVAPNIVVQLDPSVGAALNRLADAQQQLVAVQYAQLALQRSQGILPLPVPVPQPNGGLPPPVNPLTPQLIYTPPAPIVVPAPPPPILIPPAPPGIIVPHAPPPITIPAPPGAPGVTPAPIVVPTPPAPIVVPTPPAPITVPPPPGMQPVGPMPARWPAPRVVYVQRYYVQR